MRTRWMALFGLLVTMASLPTAQSGPAATLFEAARKTEVVDGDCAGAIKQYQAIVDNFGKTDRHTAAMSLLRMADCQRRLGDAQAKAVFERIIKEFSDQTAQVSEARARLAALGVESGSPASSSDPVARPWWTESHQPVSVRDGSFRGYPSPDGKYIVFQDRSTIAVQEIATSRVTRLVTDTSDYSNGNPVWTRDSRRVVYERWFGSPSGSEIHVIDITGANDRVVLSTHPSGQIASRDLTPDGRGVLVELFTKELHALQVVDLESGRADMVKRIECNIAGLQYSPDGQWIAYTSFCARLGAGESGDVMVIPASGGDERRLVPHGDSEPRDRFLGWAPSGAILFTSRRGGTSDLWLLPFAGGRVDGVPLRLARDIGWVRPWAVTSDGSLYVETMPLTEIFLASVNEAGRITSDPSVVSLGTYPVNTNPHWSADGGRLAYLSGVQGRAQVITVLTVASGQESVLRPKLPPGGSIESFSWAPDARWLVALMSRSRVIISIDASTAAVTTLVSKPAETEVTEPRVLPDGQGLAFVQGGRQIVIHMLADGSERVVYECAPERRVSSLALSPDGRIAFFEFTTSPTPVSIQIVPLVGGTPRRVAPLQHRIARLPDLLEWMPDGRSLVVVDRDVTSSATAELVRVDTGAVRDLGLVRQAGSLFLSPHPDGKRLAFSGRVDEREPGIYVFDKVVPKR